MKTRPTRRKVGDRDGALAVWQWLIQGIITVALAALAAFGGMRVGLAESRVAITMMQSRLDRIEDKLDRIIEDRTLERGR